MFQRERRPAVRTGLRWVCPPSLHVFCPGELRTYGFDCRLSKPPLTQGIGAAPSIPVAEAPPASTFDCTIER